MKTYHQISRITGRIVDKFFIPDNPTVPQQTFMGLSRLIDTTGEYAKMEVNEKANFTGQTYLIRVR